ncbi:nucleoside phosphorylase [Spongiivirga citrea]|uniref:Uridine phosphorylase n=1 Tax=Spongiivirga citrea TaxID=1481457 RepID=A0A6M0CI74_9FLAO|nr:nucleoside phosphorylase [Spongiivirga citrea]NER15634.1 phosphorylase [Spongiivirga citrea]
MWIAESELIINPDGSIYHLNLKPEQLAETIITVGDPDRVAKVTDLFDSIEFTVQKREFKTTTGSFKGKRITVISTGIGTDNIDIVFNELDALVNIDFETRTIKEKKTSLQIIRIGTSGSIQASIPVGSFLISEYGIGFDGLMHFYDKKHQELEFSKALKDHLQWDTHMTVPYTYKADPELVNQLSSDEIVNGITVTNAGFYGPQGRQLRLQPTDPKMNDKLASFNYNGKQITNLEMETAANYGLAFLLGHKTVSMNAIIANRAIGDFSPDPYAVVKNLIEYTLNKITADSK